MLGLLKICTAASAASLDLFTNSVFIDPIRLFLVAISNQLSQLTLKILRQVELEEAYLGYQISFDFEMYY